MSKQLCSVLAKLPPLRLLQGVKCARKIRGHLVVAFTVEMSFVMCIRVSGLPHTALLTPAAVTGHV